ncbi:hypothetical protein ACFLUU_01195 [Chloroflexota bacterium]
MKKIVLSNSQIQQVINLRDSGISWVKIEKETGIARRIAKRDYDEWAAKQSQRQLEDARKEVVAQEYRMHLDLLSQMANLLLDSLVIPHPLTDMRRADEAMSQFLAKDIYQDQPSFGLRLGDHQRDKRVIRMNELLLKSLRDHTERKVPWQVLDIWKGARNSCVKDIEYMKKEIHEVFTNILDQKSELKEKLDKGYMNSSVTENIKKGILINIWLGGITGVNSQVTAMKGVSLTKKGTGWVVFHENAPAETNVTFDRESSSDNEWLAREVSDVSIWVIANLLKLKSDLMQKMKEDVSKMQENASQFEAVLNPLVLRPIILNTQCDICPI